MRTALKIIPALAFVMSPFGVAALMSYLHNWNDMQDMGASLMCSIISPFLMFLVVTVVDYVDAKGDR